MTPFIGRAATVSFRSVQRIVWRWRPISLTKLSIAGRSHFRRNTAGCCASTDSLLMNALSGISPRPISPLQGWTLLPCRFLGRCPGLSHCAPSGLSKRHAGFVGAASERPSGVLSRHTGFPAAISKCHSGADQPTRRVSLGHSPF